MSSNKAKQSTKSEVVSKQSDTVAVWLKVDSFDELMSHEKEIVRLINNTPMGGNLFLIHPFMLLADIGVQVSDQAHKDILYHEPQLTGLSPLPYQALKASKDRQNVRFILHGLFERGKS